MVRTLAVSLGLLTAVFSAEAVAAVSVAPGIDLISGEFRPGTQPDGNTIVVRGRDGLVVFDTGRHRDYGIGCRILIERDGRRAVLAIASLGVDENASAATKVPEADCRSYFSGLDYALTDRHLAGLTLFFRKLVTRGLAPEGSLQFLHVA